MPASSCPSLVKCRKTFGARLDRAAADRRSGRRPVDPRKAWRAPSADSRRAGNTHRSRLRRSPPPPDGCAGMKAGLSARPRRARLPGRTLHPRLASLRLGKTPGQRPRRQASPLPPLSTTAAGILDLPYLPETVRTRLYAAHRWPSQPRRRRSPNRSAKAIATRSPLSTRHRRS